MFVTSAMSGVPSSSLLRMSLRLANSSTSLETILTRNWLRRGLLAWVLWPLSLLFRMLVAVRRALYRFGFLRSTRLPVPIIVVGNIFIGGTGKTPLTLWLVDALRNAGYRPGVISRGYGTKDALPRLVSADALPSDVGDEPVLIARRGKCPVLVGRDRVATGKALLAAHPEVDLIISDDGLQHYALQRNVEIAMFDARGIGNGWMLPAGPLREPATRLRDFTIVNGARCAELGGAAVGQVMYMQLISDMAERLSDRSQKLSLPELQAKFSQIRAAAGIGNPARFFAMLRAAGVIFDEMPLPDHYDFSLNPFRNVTADIILITEKDAVKCAQIDGLKNDPRLWVVPVTARIDDPLAEQILEKIRGHSIA